MKILIIVLIHALTCLASTTDKDSIKYRDQIDFPEAVLDLEELNKELFSERKSQHKDLVKIKYHLLNGEISLAKFLLRKLTYTKTNLRPLVYRYLALISFVESDFLKTYEYLSVPELQDIPHFGKVCILRVLTEIVLEKKEQLEESWKDCQSHNVTNFRNKNLIWLDLLVELKTRPKVGITSIPFKGIKLASYSAEEIKIILKLALYLNQEEMLAGQLTELTIDQLEDPEIREIIGQIFFRTGAFKKAYQFIEDLKSPNAENIKGNIYVLRKKYEIAYAQFKLALEQKSNSQNALERLLPLAWILGDWESGVQYSEQLNSQAKNYAHKLTLMAAFQMQKGEYNKAGQTLNTISYKTMRGTELSVTQLASFTSLMQNKAGEAQKNALLSCEQYDLINCWILFQLGQWEDFPLMLRREEEIPKKNDWEKLTKSNLNEPLKEAVFVNQVDIEELDDKLIQLIP